MRGQVRQASDGVLGVAGANNCGYLLTTTGADTPSTADKSDSRLLSQVYSDGVDAKNNSSTAYEYYSNAAYSTSAATGAGQLAKTVMTPQSATGATAYE